MLAHHAARIARARPVLQGPHTRLLPCPTLDFTAAGLPYFPSYAAPAERADFALGALPGRWIVARDVVYLGNVEPGEAIDVTLHRQPDRILCRLARTEGRALALMRSRYRPSGPDASPSTVDRSA